MAGTGANSTRRGDRAVALRAQGRRRLHAVGRALLQQAVAGRHLPALQGHRRGGRHPDGALQRARPHRGRHAARDRACGWRRCPASIGIKEATGDIARAGAADPARAGGLLDLFRRRRHGRRADAARRPRQRQRHGQRRAARRCRRSAPPRWPATRARPPRVCSCSCCALHQALFVEPSPAPTKWALAQLGRCGATRAPADHAARRVGPGGGQGRARRMRAPLTASRPSRENPRRIGT